MSKIAICWIGIGDYNVLFEDFYNSFKLNFCTDEDRKFIIFTDRPEITNGKDDCITYIISNPCLNKAFIMFRKFRYLMMAEDIFLGYDYVSYFNGNCVCKQKVCLDEMIDKNKPISCISHYEHRIEKVRMYYPQTTASFEIEGEWLYMQSGLFIMPPALFLYFANTIECWRSMDKVTGGDKYVITHDECYVNRFYYQNRDLLNVLEGRVYACPSDHKEWYEDCKIACMHKQDVFAQKNVKYIEPFCPDLYRLR